MSSRKRAAKLDPAGPPERDAEMPRTEFFAGLKSAERAMAQLSRQINNRPRTQLDEAQELIYDAWDAPTSEEAVALANKALTLTRDCADAYVILAEESAESVTEAIDLFAEGVRAGERALGRKFFKEHEGEFWLILDSRPYMRARFGLAQALWDALLRYEAIDHYDELIRLNPTDSQGVRYSLLPALIEIGDEDAAESLYLAYPDDNSAFWLYSRALLDFRMDGESVTSNDSLRKAVDHNEYVPTCILLGPVPANVLPESYSHGDENEAILYASGSYGIWRYTPGAFEWMMLQSKLPELNSMR